MLAKGYNKSFYFDIGESYFKAKKTGNVANFRCLTNRTVSTLYLFRDFCETSDLLNKEIVGELLIHVRLNK